MTTEKWIVFGVFIAFACAEACRNGFVKKPGVTRQDNVVDAASFLLLALLIVPAVFLSTDALMQSWMPHLRNTLAHWNFAAQLAMFIVFDDLMQYAWHRTAHNWPPLYALHRAHHEGEYMSVRVAYRNNAFYYLLMPSLWLSALLVYTGLGLAFAVYLVIKQTVVFAAHSDIMWDRMLYRHRFLHPFAWLVERTISTPSTHFMHHGKHLADGITHYKGNFGNLLFLWDVIFGTARITRRYPEKFGVEGAQPAHWFAQILSPRGAPLRSAQSSEGTDQFSRQHKDSV
jgi:sterol desaturase/sphingolipid hydroxylase (fatty acid hydroxylase superfamily)